MVLYSFNGWTQIVQLPVFRQIRLISRLYQKEKTQIISYGISKNVWLITLY